MVDPFFAPCRRQPFVWNKHGFSATNMWITAKRYKDEINSTQPLFNDTVMDDCESLANVNTPHTY